MRSGFGYFLPHLPGPLLCQHLGETFGLPCEIPGRGNLFVYYHPQGFTGSIPPSLKRCPLRRGGEALVAWAEERAWARLQIEAIEQGPDWLQEAWGRITAPPKTEIFEAGPYRFPLNRPYVMGIFNLTPDSFYDGGRYLDPKAQAEQIRRLIQEGTDIIDLGGESTRPGSEPVDAAEQIRRIGPVLETLTSHYSIPISIDTTLPEVARFALERGACMINDVSGLRDPQMISLLQEFQAGYVLMHTQGTPKEMQMQPHYEAVLLEVLEFFGERLKLLHAANLPSSRIMLDPGIGFGKMLSHNLDLLRFLEVFVQLGHPLLVGTSNKSFLGTILGEGPRLYGSLASQVLGLQSGAHFFRVHEVAATKDALRVAAAYWKHPKD